MFYTTSNGMKTAFFSLMGIFAINAVGLYYGWYLDFFWFDMALHFLGGFFIAMMLASYLREHLFDHAGLKDTLIILGAVAFIGVVWEFSEYIASQTLTEPAYRYFGIRAYFMGDLDDTMNDLAMDIIGGTMFALLHLFRSGKAH